MFSKRGLPAIVYEEPPARTSTPSIGRGMCADTSRKAWPIDRSALGRPLKRCNSCLSVFL